MHEGIDREAAHDLDRGDRVLFSDGHRVMNACVDNAFSEDILRVEHVIWAALAGLGFVEDRLGRLVVHLVGIDLHELFFG
jgi:hypothetical protein